MGSIEKEKNILLMYHDHKLVSDIAGMLAEKGYVLHVANDLNQATDYIIQERAELGIFEINGNGSCYLNCATDLYDNYGLHFIVVSESREEELINRAVLSGALSYLLKPFTSCQLIPVIETALKRADDIRKLRDNEQNLSTAINSSRVISAAIGIIMERFRLNNQMAFELLRSEARSNQKKIIELANEILSAAETVNNINHSNHSSKK